MSSSSNDDRGHGHAGGWSESGFDSSIPVWGDRARTVKVADLRRLGEDKELQLG